MRGSINAKYYGVKRVRVDEKRLAVLAAIASGVMAAFNSKAEVLKSKALMRTAKTAPMAESYTKSAMKKFMGT